MKAIIAPSIASKVYPSPPIHSRRQWKRAKGRRSMRLSVLRSASASATSSAIVFSLLLGSSKVSRALLVYPREAAMAQVLFRNFRMLDPERDELVGGCELLVEGESIREVSERPIRAQDALAVDCRGRPALPRLLHCPAHVLPTGGFLPPPAKLPLPLTPPPPRAPPT